MSRTRRRAGALAALLIGFGLPVHAQQAGEAITFDSHGSAVHGRVYRAPGPGPHPTILLLHGYPGGTGDLLGLGQAATAMGWSTLTFQHRGTHESEGSMSLENNLGDVVAALDYLRVNAAALGVDTARVAAVGYSAGGWLAFMAGIRHPEVKCVAGIAPGNFGMLAQALEQEPAYAELIRAGYEAPIREGLVRAQPWEAASAEDRIHAADYDLRLHTAALAGKPILVTGGWRDREAPLAEMIVPLVRALWGAGHEAVTPIAVDDDHTLRRSRPQIRQAVLDWLATACSPGIVAPQPPSLP